MTARAPVFGVLAALLLSVAFYFLAYNPKVEEQEALQAETATLATQAAELESQVAQLRDVQAREPEVRAALARLDELVPFGGTSQPQALNQFQMTADAAGVEILSVTFGEPVAVEGAPAPGEEGMALAKVPVTMNVDGGYFQVVDLLRRLEVDNPRALLIDNVAMAESQESFPALSTTWTGSLFAVVPVIAEPAPAATEGAEGAAAEGQAPTAGATPAPNATPAPSDGETTS